MLGKIKHLERKRKKKERHSFKMFDELAQQQRIFRGHKFSEGRNPEN